MPADPAWNGRLVEAEKIADHLNRYRLTVPGRFPHEKYELWEGDKKLATVGREELAAGLDLTRLADLSTNVRAAELGKLAAERGAIARPGVADRLPAISGRTRRRGSRWRTPGNRRPNWKRRFANLPNRGRSCCGWSRRRSDAGNDGRRRPRPDRPPAPGAPSLRAGRRRRRRRGGRLAAVRPRRLAATVLEAVVPYAEESLCEFLGRAPTPFAPSRPAAPWRSAPSSAAAGWRPATDGRRRLHRQPPLRPPQARRSPLPRRRPHRPAHHHPFAHAGRGRTTARARRSSSTASS